MFPYNSRILLVLLFPLISVECWKDFETCDTYSWFKYKDNCYSFEEKQKLSFYDAEKYCRSQGGSLLSVHDKDEIEFLEELIEDRRFYGRRWIGLNVLEKKGKYRWSDGSPVDYLDLYPKKQYKIEKCFILYTKGAFRPEHCELRYRPICKKPASGTPPVLPPIIPERPHGNCPEEWHQIGQKCFKFFGANEEEKKTYRSAKESCISIGEDHDLASVHSMEEQAFLIQKMGEFGSSVWIGLNRVESDEIGHELVYGWTDNSIMNFTYWAPGYPQSNTWQTCIRLSDVGVGKGYWIGDFCDTFKHAYVCGRPPVPNLPPPQPKPSKCGGNSGEYRGDCYTFYSSAKTWNEAEKLCQGDGGHLVSVKDSFEEAYLYNFVRGRANVIWNGLANVEGTRLFRWSDNSPFYFSNWKKLPAVTPGTAECTTMDATQEMKWSSADCKLRLPFICKISTDSYPEPKDVIGSCPTGESSWVDIGDGYCYHTSDDGRSQWGSLSRYCLSKGMEMLTLSSAHQTNSLITYLWKQPYNYWIGLIRTFDKKSFMWVDQSPLNYTNWDNREPKTYSTGEDCASFSTSNSKWRVESCSEWRGSICRAKKVTVY